MGKITIDDLVNQKENVGIANQSEQENIENSESPKSGKQKKEKKPWSKKKKAVVIILAILLAGLAGLGGYGYYLGEQEMKAVYLEGIALMEKGQYEKAYKTFENILNYSDASTLAVECLEEINNTAYNKAMILKEEEQYEAAIAAFEEIKDFGDSAAQIEDCNRIIRANYIDKMGVLLYKINKYKELAVGVSDVVFVDWKKAIKDNKDVTMALQETFKSRSSEIRSLNIGNEGLNKQVEALGTLESASDTYIMFMRCFEIYNKIHEQSVQPSGDVENYEQKMKENSKQFDSFVERLYVIEPSIKTVVARETKKAEKESEENEKVVINTGDEKK